MKKLITCSMLLTLYCACLSIGYAQGGGRSESPKKSDSPPAKTTGSSGRVKTSKSKQPAKSASAELIILTKPTGCAVLIEDQPKGNTDANGSLTIRGLKPGAYTVTVRKQSFQEMRRVVEVAAGQKFTSEFMLAPMPGTLSVTSNLAGVMIEVSNSGTYPERVNGLSLPPGNYHIAVSKLGYRTATRDVEIKSAQPLALSITPEKLSFEELMKQAIENFTQHKYAETIALSNEVLLLKPDLPQAHYLLAYSYYLTGNYEQAFSHFKQVIAFDGKDVFQVRHRHNGIEMCIGAITLTKTTFAFKSETAFGHDFEVPYSKFKEFNVQTIGGIWLHTKVRIPKRDGRKGEDEKDYNFYVPEAEMPSSTIGCSNCQQRMELINQLMLWASRGASGGQ